MSDLVETKKRSDDNKLQEIKISSDTLPPIDERNLFESSDRSENKNSQSSDEKENKD